MTVSLIQEMFIAALFIMASNHKLPKEMNKQKKVHPYNALQLSNHKKQTTSLPVTWMKLKYIMLSERNQTPNRKEYTLFDSIYAKFENRQKFIYSAKVRTLVASGGWNLLGRVMGELSGMMDAFCVSIWVVVLEVNTFVKTHPVTLKILYISVYVE